jgi:hydroxymethylpyrimidine/phosphomethylpyrimidine kinase
MVSSSGHRLLDKNAVLSMTKHIYPLASLVTPNIPETAELLAKEQDWIEDNLKEACKELIEKFSLNAVLLKCHLTGNTCEDTLAAITHKNNNSNISDSKTIQYHTYKYPKITTRNTHGTGCTLASAITAYMA